MRLFLLVLSLTCVLATPAQNAREHQSTPLWVNIPFPYDTLKTLVPYPLQPDVYQGNGQSYINFLTYNLDELDVWVDAGILGSWWQNTNTTGWVTKLNILVWDPKHQLHGYLIHDIDFQNNGLSGTIRSGGALAQQKIPSQLCSFTSSYASGTVSMNYQCLIDGYSGTSTYTQGAGHGLDNPFVNWIVNRPTKYLKQFDGSVVYANESYPDMNAGLNNWYPLNPPTTPWKASVLSTRFGLSGNYPICQEAGTCFWAAYYGLIDHANTGINATINDVALDASVIAPDSSATTTSTSNNMIWLYGILIGCGTTLLIITLVVVVIRIHARGKQVVQSTTQHAEMP